jgi:hypothetical protein
MSLSILYLLWQINMFGLATYTLLLEWLNIKYILIKLNSFVSRQGYLIHVKGYTHASERVEILSFLKGNGGLQL